MIRRIVLGASLLLLALSAVASAQHMYVMYYSRSPQQDLEVSLVNATSNDAAFRIDAYDVAGTLTWQDTGQLAPHDSTFRVLSSVIDEDPAQWGVLLVVSDQEICIGLEYSFQETLYAVDLVMDEVTVPQDGTVYSLTAYHTEVGDAITALMALNPFSIEAHGLLNIYASDGSLSHQEELTVPGHGATIFNVAELVGQGSRNWGGVELLIDRGMLALSCKFLKSGIVQVDNVTAARPLGQTSAAEPDAASAEKED